MLPQLQMPSLCPAQSVINRSLKDRQALLKDLIRDAPEEGFPISAAMTGRVVALLPGAHSPALHQPLVGAGFDTMPRS